MKHILYSILLFSLVSCRPEVRQINYGTDECDYCRMTIVDDKYAAELVTITSKAFVFDAAECMLNYMKNNQDAEYRLILVTDYFQPRKLIDSKSAWFVRSKNLPSPMGMYITSTSSKSDAEKLQSEKDGEIFNFQTLKDNFPTMKPL